MKNIFFILFCLSNIAAFTQTEPKGGMEFFHGTWEEALKKAKEEDKLIFVDAYTTWCGPCKMMANNIFPLKGVGDFYNANFINYKLDMEKGEGPTFARKYNVNAYPTFHFINAEGKSVYMKMGGSNEAGFIAMGQEALKKNDKSGQFAKDYEKGNREPEFLRKYAYSLMQGGQDYQKVANEYIRTQQDFKSKENLTFIFDFTNQADSKLFDLFIQNKGLIEEIKGVDAVKGKAEKACRGTLKRAIELKSPELLKTSKAMLAKVDKKGAKAFAYQANVDFYQAIGDDANYVKACDKLAKKVISKDAKALHELARTFDWNVKDAKGLKKAEGWAAKAVKLAPNHDRLYTYANLLFKNGNLNKALEVVNRSIDVANAENVKPSAALNLKAMIEEKLKK